MKCFISVYLFVNTFKIDCLITCFRNWPKLQDLSWDWFLIIGQCLVKFIPISSKITSCSMLMMINPSKKNRMTDQSIYLLRYRNYYEKRRKKYALRIIHTYTNISKTVMVYGFTYYLVSINTLWLCTLFFVEFFFCK